MTWISLKTPVRCPSPLLNVGRQFGERSETTDAAEKSQLIRVQRLTFATTIGFPDIVN